MDEGYVAIQRGGGLPVVMGGGSLMTHIAGSITSQSIAFNYVMASEPYRFTFYIKQVMAGLQYIKVNFFETLMFLDSRQHFRKVCKYLDFHQNNILQNYFSKSVHGYITIWFVKQG
jgi:hypothetical protein